MTITFTMTMNYHHHHRHRHTDGRSWSAITIIAFQLFHCTILPHLIVHYAEAVNYWRRSGPLSPDLKLGAECCNSIECLLFVPHSQCDWDKRVCTCQPYHILYNETMCLPASLLGYACTVNEQCTVKVKNSECVNGLCQCQPNFLPLRRDKCLPPAKSGDFCLNDQQCLLGNQYSSCKYIIPRIYGKCRCLDGYQANSDKRCSPSLGSECDSSAECNQVTPNSFCAKFINAPNVCQCKPGFVKSKDHLSCQPKPTAKPQPTSSKPTPMPPVKITDDITNSIEDESKDLEEPKLVHISPVSLGKACNFTFECQLRDPYTKCIDGRCACMKPSSGCSQFNTGCYNDTFQCRNGQCVSWYFVCDSNKNCDDGSDETDCKPFHCPKEAFQCRSDGSCRPRSVVCNGKRDCPDGSDEARCFAGRSCDQHAWKCRSGQCLPQFTFCNAVSDCLDGSDEEESVCENTDGKSCPPGMFTCSNQLCRSTAILCSGVDGCGDNSDEDKCEVCYCEKP